jgi:hypothetical protein
MRETRAGERTVVGMFGIRRALCAGFFVLTATSIAAADAPSGQTMTAKVVQVLAGHPLDLPNTSYSAAKPLACYSAQDGQRVRCGARIAENDNQAAEDYLQIYVAEDNNEFDRARAAVDAVAQKQRFIAKEDEPVSLNFKSTGHTLKLVRHCTQGLGQANTFAFCALAVGAHVVIESQVSPHAVATADVTVGPGKSSDDLDRASDLSMVGALSVLDTLTTILTPGLSP